MRITTREFDSLYFGYPASVALVFAAHKDKRNFMAAAWHTPLSSSPPLYGVAITKKRATYGLIQDSGEFTLNFIAYEKVKYHIIGGRLSGRDVDKIKEFDIPVETTGVINTPILSESYASLLCAVHDIKQYGDHDLIAGEVKGVSYRSEFFDSASGYLLTDKCKPVLYLGNNRYITVDHAGFRYLDRNNLAEL